jgi:hypothetical protein
MAGGGLPGCVLAILACILVVLTSMVNFMV